MTRLVIAFFLFSKSLFAIEINCAFEEVYTNGETQQGFVMIQHDKIRYEYNSQKLYTLLYVNEKLFMVQNQDRRKRQVIENHNNLIPFILEIYEDYPSFEHSYKKNNNEILIEKGTDDFIKRLAVKSNELNISIFFKNCQKNDIYPKYFEFNPFIEYVPNQIK